MTKVNRTFRLDRELSKALDKICVRYGDKTYHVESALRAYIPSVESDNATIPVFTQGTKKLADVANKAPSVLREFVVTEHDRLFDAFWLSGIRKVNKKKTKSLFNNLLKKLGPTYSESFANKLIADVKDRLNANQLGFAEMHPTTYLNGERWNDEVIPNGQENQSGRNAGGYKLSAVERVRATNEANRAARANNRDDLGDVNGCVREQPSEPIRGGDAGSMDSVIEGDYTHTN
jgi:hypothetical protein